MSTSRTSQGSQGPSLQEDSRSTYESNLLEDQSIPSHGDVHGSLRAPAKIGKRDLLP